MIGQRRLGTQGLIVGQLGRVVTGMSAFYGAPEAEATRVIHHALDAGVSLIDASDGQGGNDADQVAFRILEPSPLAYTRHPSNAALGPRLWGVVLLEHHAATRMSSTAARTSVTWMTACVNSPDDLA